MYVVYGLVDSAEPSVIRYVGKTMRRRFITRLTRHKYDAAHGETTARGLWIKSVQDAGRDIFSVALVDAPTEEEALRLEVAKVSEYRAAGYPLVNMTAGGAGARGLKRTPEQLAKFRTSMRGQKRSPEARERMRLAHLGHKHTPEARQRMCASRAHLVGKKRPPEVGAKVSASKMGFKFSAESRKKMSESRKAYFARLRASSVEA